MRLVVALFLLSHLLLVPIAARADAFYEDADTAVHVFTEVPCPPEIAVRAEQGSRGNYRLTHVRLRGKAYAACSAPAHVSGMQGVQVHLIYEDGDQGAIPWSRFRIEAPKPGRTT